MRHGGICSGESDSFKGKVLCAVLEHQSVQFKGYLTLCNSHFNEREQFFKCCFCDTLSLYYAGKLFFVLYCPEIIYRIAQKVRRYEFHILDGVSQIIEAADRHCLGLDSNRLGIMLMKELRQLAI